METENDQVLLPLARNHDDGRPGRQVDLLDAVHPFLLLFGGGGRDAVEGVVALHDPSVSLRLACFYHLVLVVRDEKLKAVLQVWMRQEVKRSAAWPDRQHPRQRAALYSRVSYPPPL